MAGEDAAHSPLSGHSPIGIMGAGPVAQALGRLLRDRGEPVTALAGRNRTRAESAAAFIGPSVKTVDGAELPRIATRILIAVSEAGLSSAAESLVRGGMRSGIALHTCGARGSGALAVLRSAGAACGVFHPLQTIRTPAQGVISLNGIAFGIAGDDAALEWANQLADVMNGWTIKVRDDRFAAYHAGAVLASNSLMAVVDAAVVLLGQAGIPARDALDAVAPLCTTSLANAISSSPAEALTGPVVRGDSDVISSHLTALADAPHEADELYRASARYLLELARRRGLPQASLNRIEAMLAQPATGDTDGSHAGTNS